MSPGTKVEVLTPDFRGQEMPLARVIAERPDVFNHNVETVPRLYPLARRGSQFLRSCRVLENAKEMGGDGVVTKSGLMTGLGESKEELIETFGILRDHGVQVLTVGQYLRPTENHLPVVRYWHPDEFAELEREAYALGFESVAAGPLVRSSYHAEQTLAQASTTRLLSRCAALVVAACSSRRQGSRPRSRWPWPGRRRAAVEAAARVAARADRGGRRAYRPLRLRGRRLREGGGRTTRGTALRPGSATRGFACGRCPTA